MCPYQHLTLIERENLALFQASGYSISAIARAMHRNKSTISRELRRNLHGKDYIPAIAQKHYEERRVACRPHKKLEDPSLLQEVRDLFLKHQWSPEQIAARMKLERHCCVVSYGTIYRAIYAGMLDDRTGTGKNQSMARHLRHRGKTRHTKGTDEKRGKIVISHDIRERPAGAEHRSRFGHWEADTVAGKQGKACLVTLVDRKSRFLLGGKATGKNADAVNRVMVKQLSHQPLHSITPDRGKEFAKHREVTQALHGVQFYFPQPHQPWQRGTNENTNGLLREYFPKGKDLTDIPEKYIQSKIHELNLRPRKCLGYRTPYEVYYSKTLHLA